MKRRKTGGFTLIELLLVVVIIGILAAMVVPRVVGRSEEARIARTQADIKTLSNALAQYEMNIGSFPPEVDGLNALLVAPASLKDPAKWKGPYIDSSTVPVDAWGNQFRYYNPGHLNKNGYDLFSVGPDGQEGTSDDVWKP